MSHEPDVRPRDLEQHDAQELAAGYSPFVRAIEVSSVFLFLGGEAWLTFRLWSDLAALGWWAIAGIALSAYVLADFISGLFHWAADTWATPTTPFVGPVFVRPFRHHHVDQLAITRHDFIEVNGGNCFIALPVLFATHWLYTGGTVATMAALFSGIFLFWIFLTNQFHSWAHQEKRPALVRWLQRWHLILPTDHHQVHHKAPFMKYYCITNGWLNEPLHWMNFFRGLERVVTACTGLLPRQDDIGAKAAVKILRAETPVATEPQEQEP